MKYTRLFFLVLLTMTAFAFNSILARLAISNEEIGPVSFALLRLLSGSIILIIIVVYRLGLNSLFRIIYFHTHHYFEICQGSHIQLFNNNLCFLLSDSSSA